MKWQSEMKRLERGFSGESLGGEGITETRQVVPALMEGRPEPLTGDLGDGRKSRKPLTKSRSGFCQWWIHNRKKTERPLE